MDNEGKCDNGRRTEDMETSNNAIRRRAMTSKLYQP